VNKTIELNSKELLILQQSIIRYLNMLSPKSIQFKSDIETLHVILKKLGVTTHLTLIKEAKERSEAK
jgi:hypothetical protein